MHEELKRTDGQTATSLHSVSAAFIKTQVTYTTSRPNRLFGLNDKFSVSRINPKNVPVDPLNHLHLHL